MSDALCTINDEGRLPDFNEEERYFFNQGHWNGIVHLIKESDLEIEFRLYESCGADDTKGAENISYFVNSSGGDYTPNFDPETVKYEISGVCRFYSNSHWDIRIWAPDDNEYWDYSFIGMAKVIEKNVIPLCKKIIKKNAPDNLIIKD